jgi:hypothetical protein
MGSSDRTPARLAAEAICRRPGVGNVEMHLGPECDYFRLVRREPPLVDASVSCCGLPEGRYAVQICLGVDPLDIAYDDECDLPALLDLFDRYFCQGGLTARPGSG